jgi:hypothetical protein
MPVKITLKSNRKKINKLLIKKQKMAKYLSKGLKVTEASLLADVSRTELAEMRSDVEFEEFIQLSQAKLEEEHLDNISDAGSMGAWQASAWFLERLFPDKYGKKDTIEHKYEIKMVTFQNIVLEIINECSPQLKHEIMRKLKKVDLNNPLTLEHKKDNETSNKIIDIN